MLVRRCTGIFFVLGSRAQSEASEGHSVSKSLSALSLNSIDDDNNMQMSALRSSVILSETLTSSVGIYKKIKTLPSTKVMELKGVSRESVEKLVTIHCGFPVRSVQEKVCHLSSFFSLKNKMQTGSLPLLGTASERNCEENWWKSPLC